jgi:hypothetical protein
MVRASGCCKAVRAGAGASLNPPAQTREGTVRQGRRGISARDDVDLFIDYVNAVGHRLGLEPIPDGRVRPHMFGKTMSIITGLEPDS